MNVVEKPDFRIVYRFLRDLSHEYHNIHFKWRLNPHTDKSFKLWMHKIKGTFYVWKMDYKIIHILFDLNVHVPYVLEPIANLNHRTPTDELVRVVIRYSQYEVLRQLRFEYWTILQAPCTGHALCTKFDDWHTKICRINDEVWGINNVVFGMVAHYLRINCIKKKYFHVTTDYCDDPTSS